MNKLEVLKKCEELLNKGIYVPRVDMIKDSSDIEGIKEAGVINTKLLDLVSNIIKPGISLDYIDELVYKKTLEFNAYPAPLNYEGFPKPTSISVNDCACHGVPSEYIIKEGDSVKVDLTTIYNGYFADSCRTFVFKNDEATLMYNRLKEMVDEVISNIKPYESYLGDIGAYIYKHAKEYGYDVCTEVGGHGVGLEFHEEPFIPFKALEKTDFLIVPGMVFTIEPILSLGSAKLKKKKGDEFAFYTKDGSMTVQIEYTIAILDDKAIILSY